MKRTIESGKVELAVAQRETKIKRSTEILEIENVQEVTGTPCLLYLTKGMADYVEVPLEGSSF